MYPILNIFIENIVTNVYFGSKTCSLVTEVVKSCSCLIDLWFVAIFHDVLSYIIICQINFDSEFSFLLDGVFLTSTECGVPFQA